MNFVREEGRLISRIEPGDVIEQRVHGPASDGYLTIVTWRQIGGREEEWFPGSPFELSPVQQAGLLAILSAAPIATGPEEATEALIASLPGGFHTPMGEGSAFDDALTGLNRALEMMRRTGAPSNAIAAFAGSWAAAHQPGDDAGLPAPEGGSL